MTRKAYLQFGEWGGPYQTVEAESFKETCAPPNYSATGHGSKIPTMCMIKYLNVWRRIYCAIFSNNGTLWCNVNGEQIIVYIDY
jgi:hypothetical protein